VDDIDRMLKMRIATMNVEAVRTDDVFDVKTNGELKDVDQFVLGYFGVYSHVFDKIEEMEIRPGRRPRTIDRVLIRAGALQMRRMILFFDQVYKSNGTGEASMSFHLENGGGHLVADGKLSMNADVKPMYEAAAKTGFPLMQRQNIVLDAHTDGEHIKGTMRMDAEGPWTSLLRDTYAQAVNEIKEAQPFAPLIEGFKLDSATMAAQLEEGSVKMNAVMKTSDLSGIAQAVLGRLAPDLPAKLISVDVSAINRGGKLSRTFDLYFSGVDDAKKMAQVLRKLLRAARNDVRANRTAQEVMPPALVAPTVTPPDGLTP
jgi:hypothetical protein